MCLMIHLPGHQDHAAQHVPTHPTGAVTNDELLGILRRRYALGEITQEQLAEMQRVLGLCAEAGVAPRPSQHAQHEAS